MSYYHADISIYLFFSNRIETFFASFFLGIVNRTIIRHGHNSRRSRQQRIIVTTARAGKASRRRRLHTIHCIVQGGPAKEDVSHKISH